MPECGIPFGSIQKPPASGVPPNWLKRSMVGAPAQLASTAPLPGSGGKGGGGTTVMKTAVEARLGIGQAWSLEVTTMFAGENAGSGVQHKVAVAGFVPTTVSVAPGSWASVWEVTLSTVSGSGSVKTISTQNGTPSQTSIPVGLVIRALVALERPSVTGGGSVQSITTKRKSRITVPITFPLPS